MFAAAPAMARVNVDVSIGVPGAYPAPVYVQPAPVYVQPRPVYVHPRPTYIQPSYVYANPSPWTPGWYAYCEDRYRSFNPGTGYFLGYDGDYHFCR